MPVSPWSRGFVYLRGPLCVIPPLLPSDMAPVLLFTKPSLHGLHADSPRQGTVIPPVVDRPTSYMPFLRSSPDKTIISDASMVGCGAHMDDHMTKGIWTPQESRMHINVLELQAVKKACQSFLLFIRSHLAHIMSDTTTTVFYINKWGKRDRPLYVQRR